MRFNERMEDSAEDDFLGEEEETDSEGDSVDSKAGQSVVAEEVEHPFDGED